MRVEYSDPALGDLMAVTDHIALNSPRAADRIKGRLFETIDRLAEQPGLGRSGRVAQTPELVLRPYIVAYPVRGQVVEVLAVIDGRRGNITDIIGGRLDAVGGEER